MAGITGFTRRVWDLYYDGFKSMTVGKTLWLIILVKLFIFFVIMKFLFFPNLLKRDYSTDEERADHVRNELIKR
ncbi:MAG: DUF4492 domain-containing protein [Muribaculaceae bacterium]|nr:DUF4492 domain-containing protein [Muribaculaceae bacterium]